MNDFTDGYRSIADEEAWFRYIEAQEQERRATFPAIEDDSEEYEDE